MMRPNPCVLVKETIVGSKSINLPLFSSSLKKSQSRHDPFPTPSENSQAKIKSYSNCSSSSQIAFLMVN